MGNAQSIADNVIPDTVDAVQMEVVRHAKVLSEINSLSYEDLKTCLEHLNTLSRKCIDPNGKQLVFLVKRGTDTTLLWKATVKIACIKVDPSTRHIESYKFLNLKQFLCVFKTFQAHLESLVSSENQRSSRRGSATESQTEHALASPTTEFTASLLLDKVNAIVGSNSCSSLSSANYSLTCSHDGEHLEECSICLDRRTDLILSSCMHSFCTPCIEQWNVNNKTCPICMEALENTDDTWVMSDIPGVEEINDKICAELMNLAKQD